MLREVEASPQTNPTVAVPGLCANHMEVYTRRTHTISVCKPQGESTPTGHNLILKKNSAELYFTKLNIKPQRQLVFQGRKLGTMAIFPIVFVLFFKTFSVH